MSVERNYDNEPIEIQRLRFYDGKGKCLLNNAIPNMKKRRAARTIAKALGETLIQTP